MPESANRYSQNAASLRLTVVRGAGTLSETMQIHNVAAQEMQLLADWAAAEGWNPGLHDAECFFAADPQGFFVGEVAGSPVGCISAVAYGQEFGFIGFYIVRPEFRGKGYGIQLWQAAMRYLGLRNIGLDGVVAQQANYQQSGFRLAYRNIRYGTNSMNKLQPAPGLVPLAKLPFEQLAAYDRRLFAFERQDFLRCWISRPQVCALGLLQQERLAGYGVLRACRTGYKIGPLFADGPTEAEALLDGLTAELQAGPIFLDAPEANPQAVRLAERAGMKPVFETARMYTQQPPAMPLDKLFGVTSFELG